MQMLNETIPELRQSFADLFHTDLELQYVADPTCTHQILKKKEFAFAFQNYVFGKWNLSVQ